MGLRIASSLFIVFCAIVTATAGFGQVTTFTLTDGSAQLTLNGVSGQRTTANGGIGDMTTAAGLTDHLFQNWFWYRTDNDTREYALSNLVMGGNPSVNHVRLVYLEPANNGATANALRVELEYSLSDLTPVSRPDTAELVIAFKLQNMTAAPLNVQFFSYNDFDLGGGAGSDSAVVAGSDNPPQIQIVDDPGIATTFPARGIYKASGTNRIRYQIGAFPTVRNLLTNAAVDTLSNAGAPFGPGDYSGANQWGTTLAASGSVQDSLVGSVTVTLQVKVPGDLNDDGCVDQSDLGILLANWMRGCR